jgi:hypothetical protein
MTSNNTEEEHDNAIELVNVNDRKYYASLLADYLRENESIPTPLILNEPPVLVLTDHQNPNKNKSISKPSISDDIATINEQFKD